MKMCVICRQNLPQADFFNSKLHKDGLSRECKACIYLRNRELYKQRRIMNEQRGEAYYLDPNRTKKCSKCKQTKSTLLFNRNIASRDGFSGICRDCDCREVEKYRAKHLKEIQQNERDRFAANPEKFLARNRQVYHDRPAELNALRGRANNLRKYNLTLDQYDQMLLAQGGVCAICAEPPVKKRTLDVDHNHETGENRGLLCGSCNRGIGHFRDDVVFLVNAAIYLLKFLSKRGATPQ